MRVERYTADREEEWNNFVRHSKSGTFLFDRRYMDYHGDRFVDFSLLVHDDRGRLIAVLPASREETAIVSHGGLTYGGFVTGFKMTTSRMLDVFDGCIDHIRQEGVDRIVYKCVPHIYHSVPAEEDTYALFVHGAQLVRRDVASAIDMRMPLPLRRLRRRLMRRARSAGARVEATDAFDRFWPVLERNLRERHRTKPVHSFTEISHLAKRFAEEIRLFLCTQGDDVLAGAVVYLSPNVCHIQYSADSLEGRRLGAKDLLFAEVIARFSSTHRWIDFGISTEQGGRYLNRGLVDYKEGFGGRVIAYDSYELRII